MNGITTGGQSYAKSSMIQGGRNKTEAPKSKDAPKAKGSDNIQKPWEKSKSAAASKFAGISSANEGKLSDKARELLSKLRDKYGDYDFFVADGEEDFSKLSRAGSKEFSVIISMDEIEKMAADEKYADEKMSAVEEAVKMAKKINEDQSQASEDGKDGKSGGVIKRLTIEIGDDGSMKIMAELEKSSEQQKARIEKSREKKAEEKKAKEKQAAKEQGRPGKVQQGGRPDGVNPYGRDDGDAVKRTVVEAATPEELLSKIQNVDWTKVADSHSGDKFNFTA